MTLWRRTRETWPFDEILPEKSRRCDEASGRFLASACCSEMHSARFRSVRAKALSETGSFTGIQNVDPPPVLRRVRHRQVSMC